jgi:hypothetical protein
MDEFVQRCLAMGFALEFRELLFEALAQMMQSSTPNMHGIMEDLVGYAKSLNVASTVPIDPYRVLNDDRRFTIMPISLDHSSITTWHCVQQWNSISVRSLFTKWLYFHVNVDAVPSDQALVQLFPYAFAAAFRMAALEERSTYNAAIDACENNMHCMAASVVAFIRYGNIASTNGDETVAKEVMNEFMRVRPHSVN